jgi:hypothetical protein
MNCLSKAGKAALLIFTIGAWLFLPGASAQTQSGTKPTSPQPSDPSTAEGWHVQVAPYLWFAGVHGTVGALGHDTSVHASFGDIFNYFNIGLMGAAEFRYNRIVMPVDFLWMKLSDDKSLPIEEAADTIKAKMTETLLTPKIGYRVINQERVKVDALVGFRYWHLGTDLSLQPTQPGGSFSDSANWVDAVGGAKIELGLSPKVSVIVLGDAGGGAANSDYQVVGALGYKISRRWVLLSGYRYLSVNYRPSGNAQFIYNVNMPGLVIGATFNIK